MKKIKHFIDIKYDDLDYKKKYSENKIKKWVKKIFKELSINNSSCSILLASKDNMQMINKKYFEKDYPTDVISFSQIEGEKVDFIDSRFLGDIIICVPVAEEYALEKSYDPMHEIFLYILHGILHLLGYDHEKNDNMIEIQNNIFFKFLGAKIER